MSITSRVRGFSACAGVGPLTFLAFTIGLPAPATAGEDMSEIVVSARRREELLQEVPLSVAVFNTEALRERNIQSVYDVATFTPNFSFNRNAVGRRLDAPSIRGQFTVSQNFGFEGNVAFYVDGAYISGTASGLTVDNLERVEVLRGPQVAQFGRGAFAGAINYVTRAPSADEINGQIYLKAGEGNDFKTSAFLSGPLIGDKLLFFASASWESVDGAWQNTLNPCKVGQTAADGCVAFEPTYKPFWPDGQPVSTVKDDFTQLGGESTWNVTGKLSWRALDNLTVNVKAEYTEANDQHYASLFHPGLNCVVGGEANWCGELKPDGLRAVMNLGELRDGATSIYGTAEPAPFIGTRTSSRRYLAEGLLDLGDWSITSLLTMNKQELESYRDLDRSPFFGPTWANLFTAGEVQRWDDHSAELRVASPQDKPIRASGGAYYFRSDNVGFQREYTGFCNRVEYGLPLIDGRSSWTLNAEKENLAFFGGLDYDLGKDVTVSVEGRYAKDSPIQRSANGVTAKEAYYSFSPRAIVTWQAAEDVNLYASVAEGNKPGGFNYGFFDAPVTAQNTRDALVNGSARVKEEKAWTYEIGAKTQWLDRRLTANVAAYYIDWTNQAVNKTINIPWDCADTDIQSQVPGLTIVNAAASRVIGTEIEVSLAATDNLLLTLNYGLQDTDLRKFVVDDFDFGGNPRSRDFSGHEAPRVPKQSVTASATYRRPLGDRGADWFLRGDYVYNSKTWLDVDNVNYVGDLNLMNVRLGVDKDAWSAAFYVDNVLDDDTPLLATQFPNFAQFPSVTNAFHIVPRRGRNAGITLTLRF